MSDNNNNDIYVTLENLEEYTTQAKQNFLSNALLRNKAYSVGDIAYSNSLPSYLRLECVKAGVTGATEPSFTLA